MGKREELKKTDVKRDDKAGRFDFMSMSKIFGTASAVAVLATIILIAVKGMNYGIDFAGGTEVQVQFKDNVQTSQVRDFLKTINLEDAQLQTFDSKSEFLIRIQNEAGASPEEINKKTVEVVKGLTSGIVKNFGGEEKVTIRRVDSVGPQVGSQLKRNAILAVFYSLLAILIYIALRFDYNYAPGAVFCLFHDAILSVGVLVVLDKEITVQTLAAVLTIIGYSINDTIVVFDRIREDMAIFRDKSIAWVINRAMNETLGRTIKTSVTTLLAVTALYVIAGGVIQDFAFIMGVGIIFGCYSTIYIAAPMIILFEKFKTIK